MPTPILLQKNIVKDSTITAQTVHIGDKYYYSIEKEELTKTIIFLKIVKNEKGAYSTQVQINGKGEQQAISEIIPLHLEDNFFKNLKKFENYKRQTNSIIIGQKRVVSAAANKSQQQEDAQQLERAFGVELYNTFLPSDSSVRLLVEQFLELLKERKIDNLTLVLSATEAEILNIPFELMRPSEDSPPLSILYENALIAHSTSTNLGNFEQAEINELALPLRLLVVTALPWNEGNQLLDLEKEQEEIFKAVEKANQQIIQALGDLPSQKRIVVEFLEVGSLEAIEQALSIGKHHILHISGHGFFFDTEGKGFLNLEDDEGKLTQVSGNDLAKTLGPFTQHLKVVFLSACETARAEQEGIAGALLAIGVPAIIAMRYPILDVTATLFTASFYQLLCKGQTLQESLFYSRQVIQKREAQQRNQQIGAVTSEPISTSSEWYTPFVYLNQWVGRLVNPKKPLEETTYFYQQHRSSYFFKGVKDAHLKKRPAKLIGKGFVGRRRQLAILQRLFRTQQNLVCIHGIGGIGKTSLAARFLDNYQNKGITILPFVGEVTEHQILLALAKAAPSDQQTELLDLMNDAHLDAIEKLNFLLDELATIPIALFFDNFEDNQKNISNKEFAQLNSEALAAFLLDLCQKIQSLSSEQNIYILFTTRYKIAAPFAESLYFLDLAEMTFSNTYKLISRFKGLVHLSLIERQRVHQRLGGHPRALELLESYFRTSNQYSWQDIDNKFSEVEDFLTKHDLLLSMLWEQLPTEAQEILAIASIFRQITFKEALEELTEKPITTIEPILSQLQEASLLYLEPETFYTHRLTSTWVLQQVDQTKKKQWHHQAAQWHDVYNTQVDRYDINDQNFLLMLETYWHYEQSERFEDAAEIAIDIQRFYYNIGDFRQSLEFGEKVLATPIATYHRGKVAVNKADVLTGMGRLPEAIDLLKKTIEIGEASKEEDILADAYFGLSHIYLMIGKFQEALKYAKQSLTLEEELYNEKGKQASYQQLGTIYMELEEYDQSLHYLEASKKIALKNEDTHHLVVTTHEMGLLQQSLGNYEEAMKLFQESLLALNDINIPKSIASNCYQIGELKRVLEEPDALSYLQRALTIQREIGDRLGETLTLVAIAGIKAMDNQLPQAIDLYNQSLLISKELGQLQNQTSIYSRLGKIYFETGNHQLAIQYFNDGLAIELSEGYPSAALTQYNLGLTYMGQNQLDQANNYLDRALELAASYKDIAVTSYCLRSKGTMLLEQQPQEAIHYFQQALAINQSEEMVNEDLEVTADCYLQIGEAYLATEQLEESANYFQQALTLAEENQFINYQVDALTGIAGIYELKGDTQKVIACYETTLPLLTAIKASYPLAVNLEIIGDMYQNLEQPQSALPYYLQSLQLAEYRTAEQLENIRKEVGEIQKALPPATFKNIQAVYTDSPPPLPPSPN